MLCVVISAILLLSFTSCQKGVKLSPKNPVTITIWHHYHAVQQTAIDNLIKTFNETRGRELGVSVEAVSFGGIKEVADGVKASAKADVGALPLPNIFSAYSDTALEIGEMGTLINIGQYFTQKELDEYVGSYISNGKLADGNLYVFPVSKSSEIFMLNKTDWDTFEQAVNSDSKYEKVSVEQLATWDGILKISETYNNWTDSATPAPNDGKAFFGLDSSANFMFVCSRQLGADLVTLENGAPKIASDTTVLRKLWDSFYVPMLKGQFASLGRFRSDDVKTGDLLAFVGSTASAAYFPTHITDADGKSRDITALVAPYPVFEGAKPVAAEQGAGVAITKSDEHHEKASAEFLKWFTDSAQNVGFSVSSAGYVPVKNGAATSEEMKKSIADLKASGKASDVNLANVMDTFIKQNETYEQYAAPTYKDSFKLRTALEGLNKKAAEARVELLEAVAAGANYDDELNKRIDDAAFDAFLASINK